MAKELNDLYREPRIVGFEKEPPKKIQPAVVPVKPIKYNPVDTTRKPTAIHIERYSITIGMVSRVSSDSKLVAYCTESPEEVLEKLFPLFHVTSFQGYHFFSPDQTGRSIPLRGLGINGTDQFRGIAGVEVNGRIEEILSLEELEALKRKRPISINQVKAILQYTAGDDRIIRTSPTYLQWKYDTGQISRVLGQYMKR